ncbi:MAG: ABC transporter permease [Dehalococcoidia bacterium]|nr:ABC transporter permease [Dehalococcoidia bacterium]
MNGYIARRGFAMVPTLFGIVTLVFLMIRLIPGDPAAAVGGEGLGEEALAALRERLGVNGSIPGQYATYLADLVRFDLGKSIHTGLPVTELISDALPVTVAVALLSVVMGTLIAVPVGAVAAYARSKGKVAADQGLTGFAMGVDTMPPFWVALVLILVFSLHLKWFPVSGPIEWTDPVAATKRLFLPVVVLGVAQVASVARVTRTAVLDALQDDYVRTARALGTPETVVLFKHALRNSALPVVTITGLSVGRLLGGTVIIENIFSIPGMGTALVQGINSRDYPIVQGVILVFALLFILVNFATDLVYTRVDPRVRFG